MDETDADRLEARAGREERRASMAARRQERLSRREALVNGGIGAVFHQENGDNQQ